MHFTGMSKQTGEFHLVGQYISRSVVERILLLRDAMHGLRPVEPLAVADQSADVAEIEFLRVVAPSRFVVLLRRLQLQPDSLGAVAPRAVESGVRSHAANVPLFHPVSLLLLLLLRVIDDALVRVPLIQVVSPQTHHLVVAVHLTDHGHGRYGDDARRLLQFGRVAFDPEEAVDRPAHRERHRFRIAVVQFQEEQHLAAG